LLLDDLGFAGTRTALTKRDHMFDRIKRRVKKDYYACGAFREFPVAFHTICHGHRAHVIALVVLLIFFFNALNAICQEPAHPLKPSDRSSPSAALKTFLDSGDAVGAFLAQHYLPSPTRAEFHRLISLGDQLLPGLDLSQVPPAAHTKVGRTAATALYETLSRIKLPPLDEISGADQLGMLAITNSTRWVIPDTEIALVRVQSGPHSGEFLFSAETVVKAVDYYEKVSGLTYCRPVPLENILKIMVLGGGWMFPFAWIQSLPVCLQTSFADQAGWKWISLALILCFFMLFLRLTYRLSRQGSIQHPFIQALAQVALPAFFLFAAPAVAYLLLVQVNMRGSTSVTTELAATTIMYLAGAWISWRLAAVIAEAIIASPRIAPESIDAHLIRICSRLLGAISGAGLIALGADRLGIPVYGIVAGLGVGGLAIALAAQPTFENLIGGLSLFADKPIRVGDLCKCGSDEGTIESIGIRSTRIRGKDRTLTTIPNAALSKMSIVNLAQRDRMLIQHVIGVRCETSPEQLRYLLVKIQEMLLSHPRIHSEPVYVRFIGFGASSLDIEVFAYVTTKDREEFFSIREDILLRVMDIVEQSGTGFAFPSQTLYFRRDEGLDASRTETAESLVRKWRDEGCLPFPNFSSE
jgi:MscS family membrane protein